MLQRITLHIYIEPPFYISHVIDFGKTYTTFESILSNTRYTIWNSNRGKTRTTTECTTSNTCHAIGNSDRSQTCASIKSFTKTLSLSCYLVLPV